MSYISQLWPFRRPSVNDNREGDYLIISVVAHFVSCPKFSLQDLCIKPGALCMGTSVYLLELYPL
jgi:hypothetical protein